jgi:hypothetical protein
MKRLGGSVRWLVVLAVTFGIVAPSEARPRPRTRAAAVRPPRDPRQGRAQAAADGGAADLDRWRGPPGP